MSRGDDVLITGITSARSRQLQAKKEEEAVKKPDPEATAVFEEIAKMKRNRTDVGKILLDDNMIPEAKLRKIERLQDQVKLLDELETRMKRVLGVKHG